MGTKRTPGRFDCYQAADPDEPMFVLLGRDKHAPMLVELWAELRRLDGESIEKIAEAEDCAEAMRRWRIANRHRRGPGGSPPATGDDARERARKARSFDSLRSSLGELDR